MKIQAIVLYAVSLSGLGVLHPAGTFAASSSHAMETKATTPTFSPLPGSYGWDQEIKLTSSTAGATIYYTTSGATPTTSSTKYKAPFVVSKTETIKAIAVASGHSESAVASGAYKFSESLELYVAPATISAKVGGETAFAVAVKNNSSKSDPKITVTTSNSPAHLPAEVTLCQSNPNDGQCLAAPAHSVTLSSLAAGANTTFTVFVEVTGTIAKDPSVNKINVLFNNTYGLTQASSSVAISTTK
jgi:hypothetical protein